MTSLQITYFLHVADSMSFSQTAEELFVSQPSVSKQIRQLEEELGYQLFDRSVKNRISLTAAGMIFRDAFRKNRSGLEQALNAAKELSGQTTLHLSVGIGRGWDMSHALLSFRDQISLQYPQAHLSFFSDSFRVLQNKLHNGEVDVIVCTKTCLQNFDAIEVREIAQPASYAYVKKGLLTKDGKPLSVTDFRGLPLFMLPNEESPMAAEIVQLQFLAHQVELPLVTMPNRESILQAILMGDGTGVFDEYMYFHEDPRLDKCKLTENIPICAVWLKRNQNPLIRLFAESMAK